MDYAELLNNHGPTGVFLLALLAFLQKQFAGGLRITVRHDEGQMKELATLIAAAASHTDRIEAIEGNVTRNADDLSQVRTDLTGLRVVVNERTKRRVALSGRPPPISISSKT